MGILILFFVMKILIRVDDGIGTCTPAAGGDVTSGEMSTLGFSEIEVSVDAAPTAWP